MQSQRKQIYIFCLNCYYQKDIIDLKGIQIRLDGLVDSTTISNVHQETRQSCQIIKALLHIKLFYRNQLHTKQKQNRKERTIILINTTYRQKQMKIIIYYKNQKHRQRQKNQDSTNECCLKATHSFTRLENAWCAGGVMGLVLE